jgi:predicted kinase
VHSPVLVVISGAVAAGKTTLGVRLAARLHATLLSKDLLKETLHEPLTIASQETSLVASDAAMRLMYSIAATSAAPLVVEANWKAGDVEELMAFARPAVQIFCTAPVEILKERALSRVHTGDRHPVHRDRMSARVLAAMVRDIEEKRAAPLPLNGPLLRLDTSGPVDLDAVSAWVCDHVTGS